MEREEKVHGKRRSVDFYISPTESVERKRLLDVEECNGIALYHQNITFVRSG
jgi:hypothetical protein